MLDLGRPSVSEAGDIFPDALPLFVKRRDFDDLSSATAGSFEYKFGPAKKISWRAPIPRRNQTKLKSYLGGIPAKAKVVVSE